MPKFLSGRQKNLKLGVKGYTENENVLDILGRVGVGTSYATEYNVGIGGSVRVDGSVSIGGTLITDYIGVGSVSIANLFVDSISIGNTLGDDGSYIRSTGTGVTWASFPTLRTGFSTVGVSSQTQIITSYNTNFLDIFVNGVLLNASEYQASDGFTIIFNDELNGGEIIDIFSYNTTSNYTGGGGGGGNITIGGDSLWTEAVVGIYTNTNVGINSDYPESALSVTGDVKVLGVITATNFTGDGSGLTNITATGTGVQIRDSGAVVGTAATIDFGDNISVSPISAGVVTVTSSGGAGGISGAAGTTGNIQFNNGGPLGADNSFNYDTAQFRLAVNNLQTNVITTTDPTLEINADTEISGILTATQFVGDGSGLTNITATGSGVQVKDSGVTVGTAATIDFGSNLSVDLGSGIATVTAQSSAYANNAGVATIATYTSEWTLGSNSIQDYTFSGPGLTGAEADPTLYLVRGQKYKFTNNMGAHPFRIQSTPNGSAGTEYNDGITNNNISNGTLIWDVQFDAPNKLYYQCTSHGNMGGVIHILDESGSGGITYWSSGSNGIHTTSNVGISTNAASSSYVLDVHGLSRVVGNFVVDDELSVNDNLFVTNVATASTLTLTKDATVGENLTVTKDLTVSRNGNFSGVVTASQFTTQTGGTPTITSPNNLNLNANIVAISTDVTIGRDVLISNNLNVSGVSTFTNLTASSAKLSELTTPHSTTTKNYSVTVAAKSDHRYSGGSGNAYYVDGVESPILHLTPGRTYRFTLSSGDMSSHPFRFYLEADKTTPYTTNVTTTATYTEIIITDTTPAVLHYQCSAHGYMGNSVITHSNVVNTPYSITGLNGVNITGVVTATSFSGDGSGLTGVASTDNIITDTTATFNNTTTITGLELAGITTGLNVSGVSTFANDLSISGNLTVNDISAANITIAGTVTYDDVTNVDSLGIGTFRQGIDIKTGGANITGVVTATGANISGVVTATTFSGSGASLTTLNASELDSGTIPDARFPSTLPAVDGSSLTGITTTQIVGYTGGGGGSIVGDTSPQLGGNLDVNGKDIVSTSNGDIDFAPNGTGAVVFKGVTSNGGNGAGRFKLNCENNSHGITIQGPPHSAAANYTLTLPNDNGSSGEYLKSDGSGNLSWDTPSGGGGGLGNPNTIRTTTRFTATSGQTSFSVTYNVGYVDVFQNGVKLDGTEFTATDGSNVVLTTGAIVNDIIEFVAYTGVGLVNSTLTTRSTNRVTATSGQTTFPVSYAIGYVDVFLNGNKLDGTEFTATDGSNVVLTTGAVVDDILEFVAYTSIGIASISSSSQGLDVTGQLETDDLNVSGILTAISANFTGNVSIAGTLTYEDVTNVDSIGLVTARSGIDVTAGHIDLVDDSKIKVGNSEDLQIYHDGSNSRIDNATGSLILKNTADDQDIILSTDDGSGNTITYVNCDGSEGSVILNHYGSTKFETTSTGAVVTGILTATTLQQTQTYPTIRPTLDLNFATTKTLDRRITFTRDGVGTYYNELGVLKYASNNVPRFDHDPITGESLGLLIEESSTNYIPTTDAASWTTETGVRTTVANDTTAPDGSNTGVRFGGVAGQTNAYFYNFSNSSVSGGKSTASWYVKKGTNRYIYVQVIAGNTSNRYVALFDMDNDAAFVHDHIQGTVSGTSYARQDVGNGWFRLSVTMDKSGSGNVYSLIGLSDDGNDTWATSAIKTITGNPNNYIYVWGPQVEDKNFATSFIPTNGTAVTRGSDRAKIDGTNFTDFYNTEQGTLVAHYDSIIDDNYIATLEQIANPGDNRIALVNYSAYQGFVRNGGSGQASIDNGTPTVGGVNKVAFAFRANDFAVSLNSATPTTDTVGTMPTVDRLMLGSRSNGAFDILKSTIRHLSYYPKRLSNTQLQGLTQQ